MKEPTLPLGRDTGYPDNYAPELLFPIPRSDSRDALGVDAGTMFYGVDTWNAWELTWLQPGGRPAVATAEIVVPADSPKLVESKSLKLYLNSFAMTSVESINHLESMIRDDIGRCVEAQVQVRVLPVSWTESRRVARLAGQCIDDIDAGFDDTDVNPDRLSADRDRTTSEDLFTHLLRSLCPVTGQPDTGSLQISYRGPAIDRGGLLQYVVSFRRHNDFHEACVERMFIDIMQRCRPEFLSLHARYQRRGGIDINPYRSTLQGTPRNLRLWRQ